MSYEPGETSRSGRFYAGRIAGRDRDRFDLATPHCYTTRNSARHRAGADLVFSDGHAAGFKYSSICTNAGIKAGDPGNPEIHWSIDGHVVP